jgi:pSer/pThr/pTyr-binding forkhead associated (FHA) protein
MWLRITHANGTRQERTFDLPLVRLGRNSDCEVAFDPATYPKVSGLHAQINRTSSGAALMHLSKSNKTLVNETPVDGMAMLQPGDRIRLGYTGPMIEFVSFDIPTAALAPVAARRPKPISKDTTAQGDAAAP